MHEREGVCLNFSGALEIRNISGFHTELLQAFDENSSIAIAFDETAEVDLAFIQLVESARLTALAQHKKLSLSAPASGAVLLALERGGFLADPDNGRTRFWLACERDTT